MRSVDAYKLIQFNTRMGMFICPSNRANVEAFLHGYQYGTGNECRFTEALSRHIAERYRVKEDALGWPHQIARLAEKRSLDWMDIYFLVSSEVLNAAIQPAESDAQPRRRSRRRPPDRENPE
jgi:hypothetical protein